MPPINPPPQFDKYEPWIRENFPTLGFAENGLFVGGKAFKDRLIEIHDKEHYDVLLIRRAVNWMFA